MGMILGASTAAHHRVLEDIARYLPAPRALEIGVDQGGTTIPLLRAMSAIDGHLWSVDIKHCRQARMNVTEAGLRPWWTFVRACSWEWGMTETGLFDLVFIDGNHARVSRDWDAFEPRVRPGGIILFHDYYGGCIRACGVCASCVGTRRLVDGVIRPGWERWECATLPYSHGLTIVRKLGRG